MMGECIVPVMGGGAKVVVGTFTVPSETTGIAVDLGGLPQYIAISQSDERPVPSSGMTGWGFCYLPIVGRAFNIFYAQGFGLMDIRFTANGFETTRNPYPNTLTFYYFAIM